MSLYEKPAHVLHDMLARNEISARELTEDVLSRMDAVEGDVGAYLLETREGALAQADAVDAKRAAGEKIPFLAGFRVLLRIISAPSVYARQLRPRSWRTLFRPMMRRS